MRQLRSLEQLRPYEVKDPFIDMYDPSIQCVPEENYVSTPHNQFIEGDGWIGVQGIKNVTKEIRKDYPQCQFLIMTFDDRFDYGGMGCE